QRTLIITRYISYELYLMSQNKKTRHNLWALTVLCLLRVRPMHPYEMQRLIGEWHKDEFLDLKRGSLYHPIHQLLRQECTEAAETQRVGKRPERTIYRLTQEGERRMHQWLGEMLSKPLREPTSFFAALSFLPHLEPQSVQELLQERVRGLEAEISG